MNKKWNKFNHINHVLRTTLSAQDKVMLVELIMRADEYTAECFPSVQRLCQARGIKHEKNFLGIGAYMPDLVQVSKRGRMNWYTLQLEAIMALPLAEVIIKHTPPLSNNPALAEDAPDQPAHTPDGPEKPPASGGANSSMETTRESSEESSGVSAEASTPSLTGISSASPSLSSLPSSPSLPSPSSSSFLDEVDTSFNDTPAPADRLNESEDDWDDIEWGIDGHIPHDAPRNASRAIETAEDIEQGHEDLEEFQEPQTTAHGIWTAGDFDRGEGRTALIERSIAARTRRNPNWLKEDW